MKTLLALLLLTGACTTNKPAEGQVSTARKAVVETRTAQSPEPTAPISKALVLGKTDYRHDSNFVKVQPRHAAKTVYLHKAAYKAFIAMYDQAKKDNITLQIISGTRSFAEQKAIWERKWQRYRQLEPLARAKKILTFSSMPATSRHHWGTDVDLNSLNNAYFATGKGQREYAWLVQNAHRYGFYQVYTAKDKGRTGYEPEKWHWSYLPVAASYLKFYNNNIRYQDIAGFAGAGLAEELHIIAEYVNGVDEAVKNYRQ